MDTSMLHWGIQFIKALWKYIIYPPLMITGLIYPVGLSLIGWFAQWDPGPVWWIIAWALVPYTFIQNIARMVTRDRSFKLWKWAFGKGMSAKEQKALNPVLSDYHRPDLSENGYPVGKQKDKWVVLPDSGQGSQFHAVITGGSGSGKSSMQVIPFLLKTKLPSFVVDIKKELSEKTAKADSLIFDPSDPYTLGYNPFNLVTKENLILDITTIANALIPVSPEKKDDFWDLEAQNYLAGCLLYLYKHNYNFTAAMKRIQSMNAAKFIAEAVAEGDEDVNVFLGHFDGMAENTLSGITATVSSKIMVFASDPDLMRCFSKPDYECIKPEDLLNGHNIYLCIPEARLEVYKHATQLMIGQFLKFFERQPDSSGGNPRVNFVLDEFFRLGKLTSVEMGAATLRSKGVRLVLICQSNAQIETLYGKTGSKVLFDNMQIKVLLSASDPETQEYYSKLTGTYDKTKKSYSDNKGDFKTLGTSGTSITTEEKRLIKPEDLATLPSRNEAILFTPKGWGRVQKQPYFCTPEYVQ